uniref:uncharacterized protein n=1 Tax=Myxine glutinosa TaxID=7769 RepID=UPI00358EAF3A
MGLYLIAISVSVAVVLPALVLTCQLPACQIHVNLSSSQYCERCSGKAIECITDPMKSIAIDINQLNKALASTDSEDQLSMDNKCWLMLSVHQVKDLRPGLLGKTGNLQGDNQGSNESSMLQFNFINSQKNATLAGVSMDQLDMLLKILGNLSFSSDSHQYLHLFSNQIDCSQGMVKFACGEHSSRSSHDAILNLSCQCTSINVLPIVLPLMLILFLVVVAIGTWWHFRNRCSPLSLINNWRTSGDRRLEDSDAFAIQKASATDEYHQLQFNSLKMRDEMFKLQGHQTPSDNESTTDRDIYVNVWEQEADTLEQQDHEIPQDDEQVYMNQEYNSMPPIVNDVYEMPDVK